MTISLTLTGCEALKVVTSRPAAVAKHPSELVRARYMKTIHRIPMRDGVKLFTIVYVPRDTSHPWPILMPRTPYGSGSDDDQYPKVVGPSQLANDEGFIPDAYQAFLDLVSLKNVDALYFRRQLEFWTQMTQHPNYDAFWEARNIRCCCAAR